MFQFNSELLITSGFMIAMLPMLIVIIKYCFVPNCKNNSRNEPDKLFISVPRNQNVRANWYYSVAPGENISTSRSVYACEDHFDLPNDASNWMFYKTIGERLKMKPDAVPKIKEAVTHMTESEKERRQKNLEKYKLGRREIHYEPKPSPSTLQGDSQNWKPTSLEKKRKQENLNSWKSRGVKKKLIHEQQPSCSNMQTSFSFKPLAIVYVPSNNYLNIPKLLQTSSSGLENTSQESLGTKIKSEPDLEIKEHEFQFSKIYIKEKIDPVTLLDITEESLVTKIKTEPHVEIEEHELQLPEINKVDPLSLLDTTEESSIKKIKTEADIETEEHNLHFSEVEIKQELKEEIDWRSPVNTSTNFVFITMPKLENISKCT